MRTLVQPLTVPKDDPEFPGTGHYEGMNPALADLKGQPLMVSQIEALIPIGEREMVVFDHPTHGAIRPYKGVEPYEIDEQGEVIVEGYEAQMTLTELGALGHTDAELQAEFRKIEPTTQPGYRAGDLSVAAAVARRKVYDIVMASWYSS